jgi:hypothetical protein
MRPSPFVERLEAVVEQSEKRFQQLTIIGSMAGFLAHFPYFETVKGGLCDELAVCVAP